MNFIFLVDLFEIIIIIAFPTYNWSARYCLIKLQRLPLTNLSFLYNLAYAYEPDPYNDENAT
jgi:hypothetical protein